MIPAEHSVTVWASSRAALVCLDEKWTRLPSGAPRLYQHYNRQRARPLLALLASDSETSVQHCRE
jgi:hypothetical protein